LPSEDNSKTILQNRVLVDVALDPVSRKVYLELEPPSLTNNQADLDRVTDELNKELGNVSFPLSMMNVTSDVLRRAGWRVTFTLALFGEQWRIVDVEPGNQTALQFGLAVDIGTTTVVGYLVDLTTGAVLGAAADYNGQVRFGDDILSRIQAADDPVGRQAMQNAVVETLNAIIGRLAEQRQIENRRISAVTVGANTTMVHLLLGLDPARICMAPYIPVINRPGYIKASEIGLAVNPEAPLYCLPGLGSYVGGDIIGGILASGMHKKSEIALFVDIGTNGEMVLGGKEWLTACAGAAGPALEGGVARHGMRAEPGAVYRVRIEQETGRVEYDTVGGEKAVGICGSGLIDCLAELLLAGIINRAGKFKDGRAEFVVVPAAESGTGGDITFTQADINNIMRTKGAVNAALEHLLESVGCAVTDIGAFYAAGAFGQYLDLESAVTIGLYPDLPREKMIRLGNSSGEGARLALISNRCRREAEELLRTITYFELNASEAFMNRFVGSKFLPHTNLDYYPTVKAKLLSRGLAVE